MSYQFEDRREFHEGDLFKWTIRKLDSPSAFVQWKGTDVCMDCYCVCGESFHVDAMFAYTVSCPHCERKYAMSAMIEMKEYKEGEWRGCEPIVGQP